MNGPGILFASHGPADIAPNRVNMPYEQHSEQGPVRAEQFISIGDSLLSREYIVKVEDEPISKSEQKKLIKREALKKERHERKLAKREKRRIHIAEKKKRMDEELDNMTPEEREAYRQKAYAAGQERKQAKARQAAKLQEAMQSGQHIIIDLDFETEMHRPQVKSLCQQLSYCHAINSAASVPVHLELTSMTNLVGSTLRTQVSGVDNWPVTFTDAAYLEKFADAKQNLVYLSADSEEVLSELEADKHYIIGGIVDRNRHKGLCEGRAKQLGIATARLPIAENADLTGNKVLTVNQVFDMLVEWMACKDWSVAIPKGLPKRKIQLSRREKAALRAASELENQPGAEEEPQAGAEEEPEAGAELKCDQKRQKLADEAD